ncbi:hypothetical protein [Alteromonas lipolytica]|uniref:Uncharacterized protein n=1 Tax=Alteromonas lipolytica TaxID=1856405 RepID=A0A1E8FFU9_9ALTE|nr:hypothetical protein [Alteromonas lipolytica]OFI34779.1 hypothetical protein BFC17_14460 [Alteromonas lipolytica]GGF53927.1 hypothetical protein GCM10011338_02600 [Alteromonas lipolytica]
MYKIILPLLALGFTQASLAASCDSSNETLVAHYTVETHNVKGDQQKVLELWRAKDVVAHHYPQTAITEAWEKVNNKLIKPTRYFDEHKRAIEYQPGEKVHGKSETNWSYRNQLFSDDLLASMTEVSRSGSGCETEIVYQRKTANTKITLTWLPELKIAKTFYAESAQQSIHWQLTGTEYDVQKISDFFALRSAYQSTDFADIGDDHTDPFLTKMVHQGFIEKGASGYYNSDGAAIEGGHHH